jgi:hypothetical protein
MYSRIPSDEQAVKAWFRDYAIGLAFVGIRLRLTATQRSELEYRLLAVCQDIETIPAGKGRCGPGADPMRRRWLADHVSVQGETWADV